MKILVVDDEPVIADTLVDILTGEGYEAFAVSDGEAALRWTEMLLRDAVITDVIMPGMDGVEVARRIVQMLPTAG
ncbi:MAG TPA: response regulator [Candidatus Angelobacter sp.]|nr:response regulator [Candidatus Angelobacter sp.]